MGEGALPVFVLDLYKGRKGSEVMACLYYLDSVDLLICLISLQVNESMYHSALCGLTKHINCFGFLLS